MIQFDSPLLIALAPVMAVVFTGLALWARIQRVRRARRWSGDLERAARRVGRLTPLALGLAAFAAGLALAGPRWGRRTVRTESKALDLVLAIDISRSMLAEDVTPSRLGRARREAGRLVHDLEGDRLGLIAFAGQSFILSPLTIDGGALQLLIDGLDPDMATAGGTELGAALRQGRDLLQGGSEVADRVLVVFTDGETHDTLSDVMSAAERLRRDGVRLILVGEGGVLPTTIPLRTPEGEFLEYQRTEDGKPVVTSRRDDVLTQVADVAHGALVPAALGDQAGAVRELVRAFKRSPQATTTVTDRPLQAWVPALVGVVLLLAQTFTRRSAALAALALGLATGTAQPARAQWGRNPGDEAWRQGAFRAAAQRYLEQVRRGEGGDTAWFNLGTAALALGDTALGGEALGRAARSLDPDIRFRALYNGGLLALRLAARDSAAREQHLAAARERYREALLLKPGDAAAKWNLELAIRRSSGGGGGGPEAPQPSGGGGGEPEPPPAARSGLTRAQAEQVLSSIADEERQVREALARRRAGSRETRGLKNW
ncbi:MAG: VWA domain-containing protein [Gemmatimonadetes bacterium]|nr:VWA domain-containing protein [Gemmatimonadota bacterium]